MLIFDALQTFMSISMDFGHLRRFLFEKLYLSFDFLNIMLDLIDRIFFGAGLDHECAQ